MKISIIGAGAMGGAIAEGLLRCDDLRADDITVCDHNQPVMDHFAQKGTSVTSDNQLAAEGSDIVMVVVKPWCVEQTLKGIKPVIDYKSQLLVVVAAGIPSEKINEWMEKDGGETVALPRDAKHRHSRKGFHDIHLCLRSIGKGETDGDGTLRQTGRDDSAGRETVPGGNGNVVLHWIRHAVCQG